MPTHNSVLEADTYCGGNDTIVFIDSLNTCRLVECVLQVLVLDFSSSATWAGGFLWQQREQLSFSDFT